MKTADLQGSDLDQAVALMDEIGVGNLSSIRASRILREARDDAPTAVRIKIDWLLEEMTRRSPEYPCAHILRTLICDDDLETARHLIENGFQVNDTDPAGQTPLMGVAAQGKLKGIQLLLQSGADIAHRDDDGWTAAGLAAQCGQLECLKHLIESGAPLDASTYNGYGLLHLVVLGFDDDSDEQRDAQRLACADYLVSKGVNIDQGGTLSSQTPLIMAVQQSAPSMVRQLIRLGADLEHRYVTEATAAHIAAEQHDAEILKLLVDAGADIEARNGDGDNLLLVACSKGNIKGVSLLLEAGVNTCMSTKDEEDLKELSAESRGCLALIAAHKARVAALNAMHDIDLTSPPRP